MGSFFFFLTLTITTFLVPVKQQDFYDESNEYSLKDENGTLTNQFDPSSFREQADDDITLYLYTIRNPNRAAEIRVRTFDDINQSSLFNKENDNLFIMHGWRGNYQSDANTLIKSAIFKAKYDINVFCVDWSRHANRLYLNSARATQTVGVILGTFMNNMMKHFELSSSKFKFVGHSLGAHVAGRTGFTMKEKPDYIVGLDPAGPYFGDASDEKRLDLSDAKFVQAIHTNGGLLGIFKTSGHANYYPNGGYVQPGCIFSDKCSHARSWQYFAESIERRGFKAKLCRSYWQYKLGLCRYYGDSFIGGYNIDKSAFGNYYLDTNKKSPFSKDD